MSLLNKIFKKKEEQPEKQEMKQEINPRTYFKKRLVCFRIDSEIWEKLKNLGIQERKSASELVREMIEEYVENKSQGKV